MRLVLILLALLLWPASILAWPAAVMNVYDGDTITVAPVGDENCQLFVKLYGVDAPELTQKYGPEAQKWLAEKLKLRTMVEIIPMGIDSSGRIIGFVALNGQVLNRELVSQGYAWVTKSCVAMVCRSFMADQKKASSLKLGMWTDKDTLMPLGLGQREFEKLPLTPSQSPKPTADPKAKKPAGLNPEQIFDLLAP